MLSFKSFLTESVTSKVKTFQIKDPFVIRFLRMGGESLIKWDSVVKPYDVSIKNQIKILVDDIIAKANPEHKKTVMVSPSIVNVERDMEIAKEAHPDVYPQLVKYLEDNGEEAVKNQLTSIINKDKKNILDRWIAGAKEDSKLSFSNSENPAIQYILLKYVFGTTSSKDKSPPVPYNPTATNQLLNKIKTEEENNMKNFSSLAKNYKSSLSKYAEINLRSITTSSGKKWLVIPSLDEEPENYEKNIGLLISLSSKQWCTSGDSMARTHLKKGKFYILVDEDSSGTSKGEIAVRMVNDSVVELRGTKEGQKFSTTYTPDILDLVKIEDLKYREVLMWVNKMERLEGKSITPHPDIKPWREKMFHELGQILGKLEGVDPNQSLFDFYVDKNLMDKKSVENRIDEVLGFFELDYSAVSPTFIAQSYSGDLTEVADRLGDDMLGSAENIYDLDVDVSYSDIESGQVEDIINTQYLSSVNVEEEARYVIDQLVKDENMTLEDAKYEMEEMDHDAGWFIGKSEDDSNLEFTDGSSIDEIVSHARWAVMDGHSEGIKSKIYDMRNDHINEYFILVSTDGSDDVVEFEIPEEEVFEWFRELVKGEIDENYYEGVEYVEEYVEDRYEKFDYDRAYWDYDYSEDSAAERFNHM